MSSELLLASVSLLGFYCIALLGSEQLSPFVLTVWHSEDLSGSFDFCGEALCLLVAFSSNNNDNVFF